MTTLTMNPRRAAFLLSEGPGEISREVVTILSGQVLKAGQVVGKVTASGKYVSYDNDAADGSQVAAGLVLDAVDATAGDQQAVVVARLAEVKADLIQWGAAVTTQGEKDAAIADLAALNIFAR